MRPSTADRHPAHRRLAPPRAARALGALALAGLVAAPTLAAGQGLDLGRDNGDGRLTVTGTGVALAEPDIAHLQMAATAEAPEPAEALAGASTDIAAVIEALRALGIADRDIQTAAIDLQPVYARAEPGESARISGYRAVNRLSVTVRDLDRVGEAIAEGTAAGADEIGSIAFAVEDRAALEAIARRAAMQDAIDRAEQLAAAGTLALGPIRRVVEGRVASPMPMADRRMAMAAAEGAPVMGGQLEASVSVSVTFELGPEPDE